MAVRPTPIRFTTVMTVLLFAVPLAAEAQRQEKIYRVGLIATTSPVSELAGPEPVNPAVRAFVQSLRTLGYVEGQNVILERRSAEGRFERFGDIVAELVRLKADVIVTPGDRLPQVAKAITTTVPIVLASSTNPVGEGLVQSRARPGGNITGLTTLVGPEIEAKRLELLKAMARGVSRVAYLASKEDKDWERGQSVRAAAQALGVTLILAEFIPHQYTDVFARISRARAEAVFVSASPAAYADRALIVDSVSKARLPSIHYYREAVEVGGLMSYGVNLADVWRRAAIYVDKILKGSKPADLPIEQPTKFEPVINLKTAKALGITVPPSLLLRADEFIE